MVWCGGLGPHAAKNALDCLYVFATFLSIRVPSQEKDKQARCTLHFALTRPDSNRWVVDALVLPRRQGQASAPELLRLAARFLQSATDCNGQVPPTGVAIDACSARTCCCGLMASYGSKLMLGHPLH